MNPWHSLVVLLSSTSLIFSQALTRDNAAALTQSLSEKKSKTLQSRAELTFKNQSLTVNNQTLRFLSKEFGKAPKGKKKLWISLHGGGSAPPEVNDQQWLNQIQLYQVNEGIYIAPRAPTDTWNLWHQSHIDPLFEHLIADAIIYHGVDPEHVYLLGYSAGGDGVWQLAPRMADYFAAAAMMAGHPGDMSLLGLRNLPFAIFCGGNDAAYQRNEICANKAKELEALHAKDTTSYQTMSRIYPGLPHWMNRKDAEALPWMEKFTRQTWPKKLIWVQDDVMRTRFYWLKLADEKSLPVGETITAEISGQQVKISGKVEPGLRVRLSDRLLNLDQPIDFIINGKSYPEQHVTRTKQVIETTLDERFDVTSAASTEWVFTPNAN